jgi:hypothetical protein
MMAKKTTATVDDPIVEEPAAEATASGAEVAAAPPAKVRMELPSGTTGVTVAGIALRVEKGVVEVEHWVAAHLEEAFGARRL